MFFRKMLFFIGIRLNRGKIVDSAFSALSFAKCISIFHLPPFSIFWSDYHLVDTVEDRVFRSFIFHLHLPSSTLCHRLKNFPNSLVFRSILSVSCQFPFKKHFHIPACLFENALLFSGSPLLFAAWDILCPPSVPFPVRYSLSPAFPSAGAFPQAWSVRSIRCLDAAFTRVPP